MNTKIVSRQCISHDEALRITSTLCTTSGSVTASTTTFLLVTVPLHKPYRYHYIFLGKPNHLYILTLALARTHARTLPSRAEKKSRKAAVTREFVNSNGVHYDPTTFAHRSLTFSSNVPIQNVRSVE